jgi:hypothetical protein
MQISNLMKPAFLILFTLFISTIGFAQSAEQNVDCSQLEAIIEDARNGFKKHLGEDQVVGYDGMVSDYDFTLMGSVSAEFVESYMFGGSYVEFLFRSFTEKGEANEYYMELLEKLESCIPGSYEILNESDGRYKEFKNNASDSDPLIRIKIDEFGQAYKVKIKFEI